MAAGHGTRMRSRVPKVLHPVCGRPMVEWVIDAARRAGAGRVVCVTRPGEGVAERLPDGVEVAEQTEGEGTGAAVQAARAHVDEGATVLILSADCPLVSARLIEELVGAHEREHAAATLLTTEELDPTGYGRIVRDGDGRVERIVETKRTEGVPDHELAIREINTGTYAFSGDELFSALAAVGETEGEHYLTDVFPLLRERGQARVGLMEVERHARRGIVEVHALAGVTFTSPESVEIDAGVLIGEDTIVGPGAVLRGATRIGSGCEIGPHSTLISATVGDDARIVHSHLVECEVGNGVSVGPFAYLRPGARVERAAKVGTFVEVKNSTIGAEAKIPHLSYIGDADVGAGANVAAGNITANYDGRAKHRTTIGADAHTGVHTSLVAPVRVGRRAYTGAGSVITGDVPDGALGISRPEQKNVEGYADRFEER
jgi:bifunctional UDP-N-acetylglucosamine pyrophosphorylase/glucosamine-1-phosphate N-acetyltransferase